MLSHVKVIGNVRELLCRAEGLEGRWWRRLRISGQWGFPGGAVVKNPPANAGDTGWSPGPG